MGFTLNDMAIGFSISPLHPPCRKVVQYHLSWCYQNVTLQGCFGQPPHPCPHFYQENPRHKKWISILTQNLTFFVLLRKFWSWFKMEWRNNNFNNFHSVTLKKWIKCFYIFGLISRHLSRKKAISCSSFMVPIKYSSIMLHYWPMFDSHGIYFA